MLSEGEEEPTLPPSEQLSPRRVHVSPLLSPGSGAPEAARQLHDFSLSITKGRRLFKKQSAVGTPYQGLALVGSWHDSRRRLEKKRCVDSSNHNAERSAARRAVAVTSENVERANEMIDRYGQPEGV